MSSVANNSSFHISENFLKILLLFLLGNVLISGCLITNCPRGGKRAGKFGVLEMNSVKQCISCGPGRSGQCFGSNICCGPFGCLMGTPETIRCQREGMFHDRAPCIAGTSNCNKNTGRCATDGICCNQESCHVDKQCSLDDKKIVAENISTMDLFNLLGYQNEMGMDK